MSAKPPRADEIQITTCSDRHVVLVCRGRTGKILCEAHMDPDIAADVLQSLSETIQILTETKGTA